MRATIRLGLALGFAAVAVTAAAAVSAPGGAADREGRGVRERHGGAHHGLKGDRVVRGEWVVKAADGSFDTHRVNNGTITAVDGSKITITRADGEILTFTVPAAARVRRGHAAAKVSALKVGDRAHVLEVNTGDGFVVKAVIVRAPKAARSSSPGEGDPPGPGVSFDGPAGDDTLLGARTR